MRGATVEMREEEIKHGYDFLRILCFVFEATTA